MRALGQRPTDQELKEIMDDFDENRDGVISFEEFLGLMVVLINKVDEVRGFVANCNTFKHLICQQDMIYGRETLCDHILEYHSEKCPFVLKFSEGSIS